MKPMLSVMLYVAMAASMRRTNHGAIIARLTTESALWPSARVRVTSTASHASDVASLIVATTAPSATARAVRITRLPRRSTSWPTPSAPSDPTSVAHRLISAQVTRLTRRSASSGSVMRPSPCVRPGSVPTIAAAATITMTHP
jgi:hypothetical protein